tara:strand:+ start:4202 stop:4927 length:726 start_codon:yes stop_codon:yes gene_type:complete
MSLDLHSINFSNIQDDKKDLYKYVYSSLDGTIYDIAQLVHFLYKDQYKVARLKSKLWYVFDGLKWKQSELGPYYELSTNVVSIYQQFVQEEIEKKNILEDQIEGMNYELTTEDDIQHYKHSLKTTNRIITNIEKIILKLKTVNTKESICKECLYLFYDPDFLLNLDKNKKVICFLNGILDLSQNKLRDGVFSDNISIVINANFISPKTRKEKSELALLLEEFHKFREKITSKRQNKLIFFV